MFRDGLTVRGVRGALLWGYADAATLGAWTIRKAPLPQRDWILQATVAKFDAFRVRQQNLRFTAPRRGGFWCWPIAGQVQIDGARLTARLGKPEQ
jgi:hypothetical protein